MALNWQHIKGVNGDTPIYTYLEFSDTANVSPQIFSLTVNQAEKPTTGDLGYIVTTAGKQTFTEDFYVTAGKKLCFDSDGNQVFITGQTKTLTFTADSITASKNMSVTEALTTKTLEVTSTSTFKDTATIEAGKALKCGNTTTIDSNKVEAPYFNATSDMRAKTNIYPFEQSAMDILSHLQTYTYTYKASGNKSYGLMAQDLLDVDVNGFSFVENAAASGVNGDYMSIRETKLIYLLIEGIKEQQEQIQMLQAQLDRLTH